MSQWFAFGLMVIGIYIWGLLGYAGWKLQNRLFPEEKPGRQSPHDVWERYHRERELSQHNAFSLGPILILGVIVAWLVINAFKLVFRVGRYLWHSLFMTDGRTTTPII